MREYVDNHTPMRDTNSPGLTSELPNPVLCITVHSVQ